MTPRRIQRQRSKGWRMPEGAVYVGRPSQWANPYLVGENRTAIIVRSAGRLLGRAVYTPNGGGGGQRHTGQGVEPIMLSRRETVMCYRANVKALIADDPTCLEPLRGRDLACWCDLSAPCHADVLLELANRVPA